MVAAVRAPAPVLAEVQLGSFRCFQSITVHPGPGFNLLAGANASGKTSLLEALYFLGRGTSFRAARPDSAIRFEAEKATLFARQGVGASGRVGVELSRGDGVSIRVDGVPGTRVDLARSLPLQVLDPASHDLISGPPVARRQFLDWGAFHVEPGFFTAWQRYRRSLQQRNAALRSGSASAAWAWDEPLATDGVEVDECRRRVHELLRARVLAAGERLLGVNIELGHQAGWAEGASLAEALRASRDRDLQMATTNVGPHRSDMRLALRTRRARDTVSRGQEKLVAAALTLGLVELVAATRAQPIVLLVDEPGADLDREHLSRLLNEVAEAPVQAFVTCLDANALTLPPGARSFHVEHGKVEALL